MNLTRLSCYVNRAVAQQMHYQEPRHHQPCHAMAIFLPTVLLKKPIVLSLLPYNYCLSVCAQLSALISDFLTPGNLL